MARGKKGRWKINRKRTDYDKKEKVVLFHKNSKDMEERPMLNVNCIFKSEELQEIRNFLGINELEDQHTMLGAVVIGKFDIVKRMLRDGYFINTFQNGVTPIMAAVKSFRLDMVHFLIQKGADISLEDKEGNNIILLALQCILWDQDSFLDFLSSVKDNKHFNPNHCNVLGYTPLHYAVKRQWKGAVEILLFNKACPNCVTKKGVTPLMMASSRCDTDAVKILLKCQADVCYEDQRGCTALCYAIAFMIQKHLDTPNACLELLVAAVNDEDSDMTLEAYLKRRLDLMINPPAPMYNEIIKTVYVNIISFFTRFIQAGFSMLLDMNVFKKVSEAIMYHINDADYIKAMLGVVTELVRYCDCCFLSSSQEQIADAFFQADCEKACVEILDRYGAVKSDLLKSALLPFFFTCTSRSYIARSWLESNYGLIMTHYTKYVRSSMISFPGCTNVSHLQIFKKCISDFQTLVDTLKNYGTIVTEEEKDAEQKRRDVSNSIKSKVISKALSKPLFLGNTPENVDLQYSHNNKNMLQKYKQGDKTYSSKEEIGINEVRTVNILKASYSESSFLKYKSSNIIKESCNNPNINSSEKQSRKKEEVNKHTNLSEYTPKIKLENNFIKENINVIQDMFISELEDIIDNTQSDLQNGINNVEHTFQDGFNLFQLNEITDEHVKYSAKTNYYKNKSKTVSEEDLKVVLNDLESIFNNILARYESTWQKQWQQGYLDAQGNVEDILKLMTSLPDLEAYHIEQMSDKWKRIKNIIKENARKDYGTYNCAVTCVTNHLLQFQENLETQQIKIYDPKVIYPNVELNLTSLNDKNKKENILFEDTPNMSRLKNTKIEDINTDVDSTSKKKFDSNENPPEKIDVDSTECNLTTEENYHIKNEWIWEDLRNKEESRCEILNKNVKNSSNSDSIKTLLLSSDIPVATKLEMINELSSLYDEDTTTDALYKSPRFSDLVTKLLSTDINNCEIFANGLLSMAGQNKQNDFKLFSGGNFGNLELGLDNRGRPVVVKKFIKQGNKSTNLISAILKCLVTSMLGIRNEYLLPYMMCFEVDNLLLIATPLCISNLGEYIPYLCQTHTLHLHALTLVKQIMYGLHYLHTLDKPLVHGNLKPSNILIDGNGIPRLADFGLQDVLYQQIGPVCSSVIWWSRETFETFNVKWKLVCSEKGDIQSAGMIAHYILSGGFHPFGTLPESILENIQNGWISLRTHDSNANDLLYWMLSYYADDRPSTTNLLTHVCLWDTRKRWKFLLTCCGITQNGKEIPFLENMHADIDKTAKQHNINSEWV